MPLRAGASEEVFRAFVPREINLEIEVSGHMFSGAEGLCTENKFATF